MKWLLCILSILLLTPSAFAKEIYLTNGDRYTGDIDHQDAQVLVLKTQGAGLVTIDQKFIDRAKTFPEEKPKEEERPKPVITRDMSLGYTKTGGNTRTDQGNLTAEIKRKTKYNEATAKITADYASNNGEMNARKFYGMLRYAYSFGRDLKWYNFYKIEGDQDRFSNIDYRLVPSIGRGYWLKNTDDFKAMAELGIGYQYTVYRDPHKTQSEPIAIPRLFVDKRIFSKMHLSEDLTMYPSLSNVGDYRLRSETALTNQINERWAFKMQLVDDYNSTPRSSVKKNDYQWINALSYKF